MGDAEPGHDVDTEQGDADKERAEAEALQKQKEAEAAAIAKDEEAAKLAAEEKAEQEAREKRERKRKEEREKKKKEKAEENAEPAVVLVTDSSGPFPANIKISVPNQTVTVKCGDGQKRDFVESTTLQIEDVTTCRLDVQGASGAIVAKRAKTFQCVVSGSQVNCS